MNSSAPGNHPGVPQEQPLRLRRRRRHLPSRLVRTLRWPLLGALCGFDVGLLLYEPAIVLACLLGGPIYWCIETTWLQLSHMDRTGKVRFHPGHKNCRNWHLSTLDQFWLNLVFLPIIMGLYTMATQHIGVIELDPLLGTTGVGDLRVAFVLGFPLMIWTLEVVQHHFLLWGWGRPAWFPYFGKHARFDGAMNLSHLRVWWGLGLMSNWLFCEWTVRLFNGA